MCNEKEINDFEDFGVFPNSGNHQDAHSLYQSYLEFQDLVSQLPRKELLRRGWFKDGRDEEYFVPLFKSYVNDNSAALYRKSHTSNDALVFAWQCKIQETAKSNLTLNKVNSFKAITPSELKEIAKLSTNESVLKDLPAILAELGVILVYEQALPSMQLDGIVFALGTGNPVIGVSFRYPRLDNFWFTLLHELAHVVLHKNKLLQPIIEDFDAKPANPVEISANRLAKASFVEKEAWRICPARYDSSPEVVLKFAKQMGIHPAIIAGMLRNEMNDYARYSQIVNAVNPRELVFNNE